jgi:hypothetical protein
MSPQQSERSELEIAVRRFVSSAFGADGAAAADGKYVEEKEDEVCGFEDAVVEADEVRCDEEMLGREALDGVKVKGFGGKGGDVAYEGLVEKLATGDVSRRVTVVGETSDSLDLLVLV